MKQTFFAIVLIWTTGYSVGITAQSLSPNQSQQTQFLWEKLNVPFEGVGGDSLQKIFANKSREYQSCCLALCHREDTIPSHLIVSGLDSLEQETIVLSSRRNLRRGWNSVVLPAAAIANEHTQGSWTLIHDGQTQALTPDAPASIYIEESTTLTSIGLRLDYDGISIEQHLLFPTFIANDCPEPDLPPWLLNNSNDPWWIGCFHEGQAVTGQALLKTSSDGIFDQPVILCEGFDPAIGGQFPIYGHGDMNWETIWNCSANPSETFQSMPNFIDSLNALGMDFIFLDFSNGTQTVAKSAALLEHLIQLCLENQTTENPAPLVVVGASMGGLIGRYALRKMELEGTKHCTRLFISIDSPFRGAWLPMSLQHAVGFLSEVSVNASDLLGALHSPAAQQMLFETITGPSAAFQELQALQEQWGLPEKSVCAAISNGNPTIDFPSINTPLLHATSSFLGWDFVNLWLFPVPGDPQHPNSDSDNWSVFDGRLINTDWDWGEDFILEEQGYCSASFPHFGNLPGSASAHLTLLRNALEVAEISVDQSQEQSMFIPVNSAFDIPIDSDWNSNAHDFDAISMQPLTRPIAMHVDITDHTDEIMTWITQGKPVEHVDFEHHFGWNRPYEHWLGACVVPASGKVTIGGTEGNGINWQGPFKVETTPCSNAIEFPQFGTLVLGDTLGNGVGSLHIQSESQLILGPGSKLHIGPSSVLHIEKDAQLILTGGEVIIHPGGALHIDENGQILVQEESHIRCNGPGSKIKFNGDLIVSDNQTLWVKSASNQVGGSIEITGTSSYVYLGHNSRWKIEGQDSNSFFFSLSENSGLSTNGPGLFHMNHVEINLDDSSVIQLNSKAQFMGVGLHGSANGAQCNFFNRLTWNEGVINNVIISHEHQSSASIQLTGLHGFNTQWNAEQSGLHMIDCIWNQSAFSMKQGLMHSWIRNTTFNSGIPEMPQLQIRNGDHALRIESSVFSDHSLGLHVQKQQVDFGCNTLQNLGNGIHIDSLAMLNISPPFGKNSFHQNNRHIKFTHGMWPDLLEGGNEFSQPSYQYFEGTITGLQDSQNGLILLPCNGNQWEDCSGNSPCMIEPISLESSENGAIVLLKDAAPMLINCDESNNNEIQPDQDSPKATRQEINRQVSPWLVYPNPTEDYLNIYWTASHPHPNQAHLRLFDAAGNLVLSRSETPDANGSIMSPIGSLSRGWYSLRIEAPDEIPQAFQIIVNAP